MKTSLSIDYPICIRQLVTLAAFALLAPPAFAQTYTVKDLGTLGTNSGGAYSQAFCINASGLVAGESSASSSQNSDPAFLYSNGQLINLGTLGGEYGQPRGINTSGQIAGYSTLATGSYRAFLYSGGQMISIGTLGADYSVAYALNDAGTLGGTWSIAFAINDQNQIAGQAYTRGNRAAHAFRLSAGQMVDLGTLGGSSSWGLAINNSGTVVGYGPTRSNVYHAFISSNGGKMQDLNKLLPAGSGWVLAQANGINDAGQIAGYGTIRGQSHAFLLTPAP